MKILALDCSGAACSVALMDDESDNNVIESHEIAARSHTEKLLPMVESVLLQSKCSMQELDAIAFGCGPGSFTGLRICLGVVQGLAFGADVPVVSVSSLGALAQTAIERYTNKLSANGSLILSAFDARMDELYCGLYRVHNGLVVLQGEEKLLAPGAITQQVINMQRGSSEPVSIFAVGSGLAAYSDQIACYNELEVLDPELLPRASAIASLAKSEVTIGNTQLARDTLPTYLRDQVAWKKVNQQ